MNITEMMNDYTPNYNVCSDNDDDMLLLKEAVEKLETSDKIIFLMYVETASLRKVAKVLGVSHTIVYKEITKIKQKIYDYIKNANVGDYSLLCSRFERICNNN